MMNLWSAIASFIEAFANLGPRAASKGMSYEPELPKELRK